MSVIKAADVDIPDESIPKYVLSRIAAYGDAVALVDGPTGRELRFGAIGPAVRATAAGLCAQGLRKGTVCAMLSPNLPEYAIAFHAILTAGGIVTTLNPVYTAGEIAHQLKDSGARFIVTVGAFADKAQEAAAVHGAPLERIYQFDAAGESAGPGVPVTPFAALAAEGEGGLPEVAIAADDVAVIPYSSGTSGLPKGVELTHRNMVANLVQVQAGGAAAAVTLKHGEDVLVGVLPFFHIYSMLIILNLGLVAGAKTVTMPKFDPGLFLKILKTQRVTVAHVAPPLVNFLAKHPAVDSVLPLPSLRELFSGAAPLGPELVQAAKARLGVEWIRQGYGMTEMSPASHVTPYDDVQDGTIGKLLPGMECKIVDEQGEPVAVGERGELCCKGPNIMKGYLNRPEATAATIDADGFLHTGDVAIVDAGGTFTIVDRVKELIKVKGFQVAPAELEALVGGWERVADVAVIGIPDERAGELPKAFVVKQKGHEALTADEVKAFVKDKVAPYKKLAVVEFVDSVPKSAAGKILRKELRKMEAERAAAAAE